MVTNASVPPVSRLGGSQNVLTADSRLAALAVGRLELVPKFSPDVLEYEIHTSSASNRVTATPENADAAVALWNVGFNNITGERVRVNQITNGSSVAWNFTPNGQDCLMIDVTVGDSVTTYTLNVFPA